MDQDTLLYIEHSLFNRSNRDSLKAIYNVGNASAIQRDYPVGCAI